MIEFEHEGFNILLLEEKDFINTRYLRGYHFDFLLISKNLKENWTNSLLRTALMPCIYPNRKLLYY